MEGCDVVYEDMRCHRSSFVVSDRPPLTLSHTRPLPTSHQTGPQSQAHSSTQGHSLTDQKHKSFFKTLIDQSVTVELKNDIKVTGTLKSVDQYLNIKLDDISVHEELRYPHLSAVKNVFIRGSVVRYVHLPASAVDVTLLEDAARRGKSADGVSLLPLFLVT